MPSRRQKHLATRGVAVAAAAGGVAAAALLQRRHLRALARDEDLAGLSAPLEGRPLDVISADGTRLHAEAFGPEGAPTFVLAHGWTEAMGFWGPVIRRLGDQGLRAVAYDLRGHGRSDPARERDYSLDRFGEDVEAVVRAATAGAAAGDQGPEVVVVGHSLGAMSIAAWAEHHDPAQRARGAALVNTGLGDLLASHLLLGELATWLNRPWAARAFMGARLPVPPFSSPLQSAVIRYAAFGPGATPGAVAFYERMLMKTPADVRAACGVALSDMDLWHAVAKLTIPTLVIAGDRDRLTPPALARRICEDLPVSAGLVELPETGHMSPLERPDEVAEALVALVRDLEPASRAGAVRV